MRGCPRCRRENSEHRRFCGACGAPLAAACRQCGFGNAQEDLYCGGCGRGLAAGAGEPSASAPGAAAPPSDPGLTQLLGEIAAEKAQQEDTKKTFEQDDLTALFDEPAAEPPKTP